MRSEEAPEPCNLVTAVMARLLTAIVSSTELLSPVMCHVMCHESNLECKHCVTLIVLLLVPVTQTAAFFLISGDNIPGAGHWLPGHRYRDTPGYTDTHGDTEHGHRAAAKTVHLMVIMISLVYGDGRQPGGLAVTGSDVVWQQCGSGDIDPRRCVVDTPS